MDTFEAYREKYRTFYSEQDIRKLWLVEFDKRRRELFEEADLKDQRSRFVEDAKGE